MRLRTQEAYVTIGDAFRVTLKNMELVVFHVERIAFGSATIRVEPWDGHVERIRIWPLDKVAVRNGDRLLATLELTEVVGGDTIRAVADCPADRFRVRMLGLKLGRSRVDRITNPDRVEPLRALGL